MKPFNLSEWGLRHVQILLFFLLTLTLIGLGAYARLGQSEDPPFTFRVMVVTAQWPGASASDMELQVADKIEKTLRQMGEVDNLRSFSRPGYTQIMVTAREDQKSSQIKDIWYQVRKKVGDMRQTLPTGVQGPYFNDEFGDTFGNIFAITAEGLSYADLKRYAEAVRQEFLSMPDVAKVEFFGEQEQRIYVDFQPMRLAAMGIDPKILAAALSEQNVTAASGYIELQNERIYVRPQGDFTNLEAIRNLQIRAAGRTLRLGDVAEVRRGYVSPPSSTMRFMGKQALGVGIAMREGGDIIALGRRLDQVSRKIEAQLPVGVKMERVADQPRAVSESVHDFVKSLAEAVTIVLIVSLLSLGFRTGLVVAITIPVVLAITFLFMYCFDIGLHKISLGALILALGLLVDDAIIAVEMMSTKMEQGWDRLKAASFAYTSTAMPMLAGTLVTAAGFLPIAMARSTTGEYTRSLFDVSVIALLVSWVAAVLFVPFIGFYLLPDRSQNRPTQGIFQRLFCRVFPKALKRDSVTDGDIYNTTFYRRFRASVAWCLAHRSWVIGVTMLCFVASLWGFRYVPQQFFPESVRPELLVDLRLPQGSSFAAVDRSVRHLEDYLSKQKGIENYVAYVGSGSPRFYLPLDQQLPQANFAQFVILTTGVNAREALRTRLLNLFQTDFPELRASLNRLEMGPPVGFPVQYRVSGPDHDEIQRIADRIAGVMRSRSDLVNVQKDWDEASKVVRIRLDTEKARIAGLSRQDVQNFLATVLNGAQATQYHEGTETIELDLRGARVAQNLAWFAEMNIPTGNGRGVVLSQIASLEYGFEPGLIWRRNRVPTVTVRANLYGAIQPSEVVKALAPQIRKIEQALPLGYHLAVGGAVEESAKGGNSVAAGVPLFILVVLGILMLQLQNISRVVMVVLSAPLGMIGVTAGLLLFHQPFGFVAMLGTIALSGMIMRNSVILIDQIDQDTRAGASLHVAIIDATVRRFRPIMLTALAAILAMIPLSTTAFFGPMAVAIMSGLLVATVLTLLFLPALYGAWYRVQVERNG